MTRRKSVPQEEPEVDATPTDVTPNELIEQDLSEEPAELAETGDMPPAIEPDETSDEAIDIGEDDSGPEEPDQAVNDEDPQDESGESSTQSLSLPPSPPDPAGESAEDDDFDTEYSDGEVPELVTELEYIAVPPKKGKSRDEDQPDKITNVTEARAIVEAFLFSTNEPLSVKRLSKLMNNLHPRTVRGLLLELEMEYDSRSGGLQITEVAGGFQMATRSHLADWMFRLHKHRKRSPLSTATLETLAIIAYKQPITKAELETIRGVESTGTMRTLQDLNLIEVSGRKEVLGRPQLYVTTDQFLKAFGLRSLADLPSIQELRHLFADQQKLTAATADPGSPAEDDETNGATEDEAVTVDPINSGQADEADGEGDEVTGETEDIENSEEAGNNAEPPAPGESEDSECTSRDSD